MRHTNSSLVERAKDFRKTNNPYEAKMWRYLRAKQTGYQFRRQHPISPFIVDFVCIKKKLVIEIDGESHSRQEEYDEKRDQYIKGLGYNILRFSNQQIGKEIGGVLDVIRQFLEKE